MNRGQLYGDGFFESMLVVDGAIPLIHLHYERILRTANKLKLVMPDYLLSRTHFSEFLSSYYPEHFGGRLRLNVIRDGGGLYFPESNQAIIQISLSDFDNSLNILKIHKNNVALAKSLNIYSKGLGNFKLLAKSEQVLLSIERQERDLDDLIVLNEKGEIVECISSNIFFIDYGTYPYVTSSNTITAGVCSGLGIAPNKIGEVIGITKAYCTRVGSGPFPTELNDEVGEKLRAEGHEFGATTGRPRRCGWIDIPTLQLSVMLNGVTQLVVTKMDVLNNFEKIYAATSYEINGVETNQVPFDMETITRPIYKEYKGWMSSLENINETENLPVDAWIYITDLEKKLGVPFSIISTGPEREKIILR